MSQVNGGGVGRRSFLGLLGAAGAAAGCSPRHAADRLIPWLVPPRDLRPGALLSYRTACRECPAGCGVTASTRDGRVVKLEGNPDDPIGRGALCARGQAAVQALYHPDRFQGPLRRRGDGELAPISWGEAEQVLATAVAAAMARGQGRVRLLTRLEPGSAGRVQRAFLRAIGASERDRVVLEPLDPAPLRSATAALLGRSELPVLDLSAARSVVSFGADLLETWGSPVEHARQLAGGRGTPGASRTRFTWIGARLSLTGVSADRWLRTRPGGEVGVTLGLLRALVDGSRAVRAAIPEAVAARLAALDPAALAARAGVRWQEIASLADELAVRAPSAVVGPGALAQGAHASQLAGLVVLANHVLGNDGRTVLYGLDAGEDVPSPCAEVGALLGDLAAGRVDVLLVHHADLGALPAALRTGDALARVPLVATFALRPDATTARAHLVLPDHHTLETFGDVAPRRGVRQTVQATMTPLADTRAASQVLMEVARLPQVSRALPWSDAHDELVAHLAQTGVAASGELRGVLQRGGRWEPVRPVPTSLDVGAAARLVVLPPAAGEGAGLELVTFPTTLRTGGDLPWLREIPDALTSISWSPWVELSPATAARIGVGTGDVVSLTTAAGHAELPVYVFPGIVDGVAGLPLGGAEAPALLPWSEAPESGAQILAGIRVRVARTSRRVELPLLEGSPYQHGREIVPAVSVRAPAVVRPAIGPAPDSPHPEHRWAMAIDLDRCNGCQACVVACHAENNVPVMGAQAAVEGRSMSWIRIERYLGDAPGGELDVRLLPMLCQQCTSAPCEPVCPVYATYHTQEGLNAQVYNRCVGTRYCSNNCPYKVRTFNWRDARFTGALRMQLNPDVTVRSRGVMEKCTFCVQRIRRVEEAAQGAGRPIADGEILPACAQTCPARAIVFGDANDPASEVSRRARDGRGFAVLEELATRPAITYLAPVRDGSGA